MSGIHENRSGSFSEKVRVFKRYLVEKPMLFIIVIAFLVIIIWLLAVPDIPGITDRVLWGH